MCARGVLDGFGTWRVSRWGRIGGLRMRLQHTLLAASAVTLAAGLNLAPRWHEDFLANLV
jgi:hypothetical protein